VHKVRRIFVEKKPGCDIEARGLYHDFKENLGQKEITGIRVLNRYDVSGVTDEEFLMARNTVFSEPTVDLVFDEKIQIGGDEHIFAVEFLPGQYDQRADSAAQCIQIITQKERPLVLSAKVIIIRGKISLQDLETIKAYYINPVDSREASLEKPHSLEMNAINPGKVEPVMGFIHMDQEELKILWKEMGLAMSLEDLQFCQEYFRGWEKRDPTVTEIRVIDTYWSDHCRHTTFLTRIEDVNIEDGYFNVPVETALRSYKKSRDAVYGDTPQDICLMDIATLGMKELKKRGMLSDLDESEEINACSIVVDVDVDGRHEPWLVMFKNETHNHPTEIEPFGGAATCLGGAIRDPLSGRAYVYQAMRVTGSGDPRTKIEDTLPGKLPQRKITTEAALGYSSYGNQIGLATGQVAEIYHEGFVAKRMEIGAVIGAVPKKNVVREKPGPGDVVILLGGRTGRDGIGGATGSSKEHTEESIFSCGAEVQKGNPPTERKIQRLFRHPEVSTLIKKCNDFGAGGVSVAIGELTDGVEINLDAVPKKYEGLDGTELAISESQERMAVVVAEENAQRFIRLAREENLEATVVAKVTGNSRLKMLWLGKTIVDISREFLNTNGVKQKTKVKVQVPDREKNYFQTIPEPVACALPDLRAAWLANLRELNVCSQKGLVEQFDSTIGAGTVFMPFGGLYQDTPEEGMVAKIPLLEGDTTVGTVMTYGYHPSLAQWSPFHGALYAVTEAVAKTVAMGGDYRTVRLTLQEYFEKLGQDEERWGRPFGALLGAFFAQKNLGIPAIGGKDSMSGTFKELHVPPTLVAFAVNPVEDVTRCISAAFKKPGSQVVLVPIISDEYEVPDFSEVRAGFEKIHELMHQGVIFSAAVVKGGGWAEAVSKMCFGNRIGIKLNSPADPESCFYPDHGSIVLEVDDALDLEAAFDGTAFEVLGYTQEKPVISLGGIEITIAEALSQWEEPLEAVFPFKAEPGEIPRAISYEVRNSQKPVAKVARPRIFMPVFPGTNCEYDSARAFERAGGIVDILVVRNLTSADIEQSIKEMAKRIARAQIIMLPGGFSAGDEPDGAGKFIVAMFRNPRITEAITRHLEKKDGLVLGICNGFQALIKLGLVPYGKIIDISPDCPTLTYNSIGRHQSRLVRTKVVSVLSPWFSKVKVGDVHTIAISHGEGRFVADARMIGQMMEKGQIATQYVDYDGNPSSDVKFNPNGSLAAIEGITSPDGRVLGKMGHSERMAAHVAVNVPGNKDQHLFESGVSYFRD